MVKIIRTKTPIGKNLATNLKNLDGKVGKVGWIKNSKYPNAPHPPIAYVATIQEYGDPSHNIPPRPFMRPTISQKRSQWMKIAEVGAKKIIQGSLTIGTVLENIGIKAAGDIRKTISLIYHPALAEKTILARIKRNSRLSKIKGKIPERTLGSITKPLIDTGLMFKTLTNSVEDEP
jgi:hypothetical protein